MNTIKRISLIIITIIILFTLSSCGKDQMLNNYQDLKDKNHIYKVCEPSEIIELLNSNERAVIVFSFPECPWCQAAIPYLNEIAKELEYEQVYYLNILKIREENTEEYQTIFNKIRYDIANPEKINAPTVIVIDEGKVLGFHIDTVESHVKNENEVLMPMTKDQIEELRNIYRELLNLK